MKGSGWASVRPCFEEGEEAQPARREQKQATKTTAHDKVERRREVLDVRIAWVGPGLIDNLLELGTE